jgi:cytochrome c-type biogenesis protein CcmH/NrfF
MIRIAALSIALFAFGCAAVPAEDVSADEGRQVQSIVRNTLSPFCPGKTLNSCPSPKAGEWRRDIREWVEAGVPEPEIRGRLQARVPTFDLSIPPVKSGWVIPVIAVVLSTLWFVVMVRKFRGRGGQRRTVELATADRDLDTRLDEELAALD